jgi:hypothetical protein
VRRIAKATFAMFTFAAPAASTAARGRTPRRRLGLVCLCVLGLAAFLGSSAPSAGAQACPNEDFRTGASAFLPDCRAYELVSPADMEGVAVVQSIFFGFDYPAISSADGQTETFETYGAFGEAGEGAGVAGFWLARRGGGAWNTEDLASPIEPYPSLSAYATEGFTEDLGKAWWLSAWEPPLTPDASTNSSNFYIRDNSNGTFQLVSVGAAPDLEEFLLEQDGIGTDAAHVIFHPAFPASLELDGCGGPANKRLCDWSAATGELSLVGVKPNGELSTGQPVIGARPASGKRAVSADGTRVFFHESTGVDTCAGVCVRIDGSSTEVVGTSGSAFQAASSDGSVAYVTQSGQLKRYEAGGGAATPLTPPAGEVQGVLGSSADGSRVYFVSREELAPGATPGTNNLYLFTEGEGYEFIASPVTQSSNWSGEYLSSRVTPDGMHVAFTANTSLTGYPNAGHTEAYLYSAASGELDCASCNPSGEPATANARIDGTNTHTRPPRNLSDNGRLFFSTEESLVPRDSNGYEDIYEYDPASGEVALITTGTAGLQQVFNTGIEFSDASASGNDVFFTTKQSLVPADTDEGVPSSYDARVDGGLASQHPAPAAPPCTGKECRGETSVPSLAGAASATVVGKGNLSQKQNKEAKKLANRSKQLRKNANTAKKAGNSRRAKQLNKKANRLAKQARNKSKNAKKCRKRNRGASK